MNDSPNMIEVEHLVRTFHIGELSVKGIDDVSLEIERGDFVAMMDPSGSGKSTLMNILGCPDRPTSGAYRLDGISVQDLDRDELAEIRNREIGFVFQQFNLLARTSALENVELPLLYTSEPVSDPHSRALQALASVGLPNGPSTTPTSFPGASSSGLRLQELW